jgi:hypothetical protein
LWCSEDVEEASDAPFTPLQMPVMFLASSGQSESM